MITQDIVKELYPRADGRHAAAFARKAAPLFAEFGVDRNPRRLHFFLAQLGHESGGLTVMTENMNYSAERMMRVWPRRFPTLASAQPFARNPERLANHVYAGRMGNGPAASGDGWRYRGRGYIQVTGRDGYRHVGAIAGLDLEGDPELAVAPENALRVACAFWTWKKLNARCDEGDFVKVTRRINGGTVGLADRRAWLDKVRRALARPPTAADQPPAGEVIAIQLALRARGFAEVGAADGIIGPRTAAAIRRFRHDNGLGDGLVDDALKRALGLG